MNAHPLVLGFAYVGFLASFWYGCRGLDFLIRCLELKRQREREFDEFLNDMMDDGAVLLTEDAVHEGKFHPLPKERRA